MSALPNRLFSAEPPDTPLDSPTAEDIKAALRRHHPGETVNGMVGQWTCIEEYRDIDLLALNAWSKADVIGYEVKVSRSDLRRELLKPHKRLGALAMTTEFYFAVPVGLLAEDEIAFEEPEWQDGDFERTPCPGVPEFGSQGVGRHRWPYGGRCCRRHSGHGHKRTVEVPRGGDVVVVPPKPDWDRGTQEDYVERFLRRDRPTAYAVCWTCGGKGYVKASRVEELAPTCWVPRDVGLITISSRGCRVVKRSPKRKDPKPIAPTRKALNDLVRWVSHRPDPRHV